MIDGQMTIEEVIEDIERKRVYIPMRNFHYEGTWPLMECDDGSVAMADPSAEIDAYATYEEALDVAQRGTSSRGMEDPEVWTIVMPAEKPQPRGESENG